MWDATWESIFQAREWGQYPGEDVVRFIARNYYGVPNRAAVKVLEVGSGVGANLWFLAREGFSFSGIEGSPTAVARTVARLDREVPGWKGNGSEVRVGDCLNLPYANDSFDAVLDIGAISCNSFEDSQRIYAELLRVAKPGGMLFSRVVAGGSWGDGTGVPAGRRAFVNCTEGTVAGMGLIRFTDERDVDDLLGSWKRMAIERSIWTEGDRNHEVRQLNIFASKS